ncbi:MAG: M48 family metallopeptidase [Clostridia bacterium]|nr:M48 family metallopeptidase [Clostridia bacterium]
MPSFQYQNQIIEYTLTRNAKRNVNFRIKQNGEVYVSAPKRVSKAELEKMIFERAEWIIQNQRKIKSKKQNTMDTNIQNASQIYLNGQKYYIRLTTGTINSIHFRDNVLIIQIKEKYKDSQEYIHSYFDQWMKETMYTLSDKLIDKYLLLLSKYHLKKPELAIRTMTGRWGSCMPSKCKITINKNLIYPPHYCLEYVVLHELAHLVEANHSKRFYAIIEEVMPDWKERKKILNEF